jgi:hypothetical protein
MTRATIATAGAIASFIVLLAGSSARAQTAQDLAGVWKRLPNTAGGATRYVRLAATAPDRLEGEMLNPPTGVKLTVALQVLPNGKLQGNGTWDDDRSKVQAAWEFELKGPDAFEGRSEWLDWDYDDGHIVDRGWDQYRFERLPRTGLLTSGPVGEEPFGDPIEDARALAGGWAGPGGPWLLEVEGKQVRLVPVGHHEGQRVTLQVERGALRGAVEGLGTAVELAASEGKLTGRSEWVCGVQELGDLAQRGWVGLELTRLPRIDGEGVTEAGELSPGDTSAPLDGVWKRDDGLYLRVHPEGNQVVGTVCGKDGVTRCRVQLTAQDGRWVGAANWDGVETRWELAPQEGGGLAGRCEWVDAHDGRVVARGWGARAFKAMRRLN